jgi:hypothetical protein
VFLAALLLGGALVPRVSGGTSPGPRAAAAESRAEAIQTVLDEREAAIRNGDREAFLATVDPGADEEFKARQAALFDGLRSVPLTSYELVVRPDEVPDLAVGLDERYTADDVYLPAVESRYRIEGVDAVDALDGFFYTFLLREGRWRIISDTDVEDLGLPSARNLWDFGPVARARSAHFTVLFVAADRTRAESLLRLAEEARDRLAPTFNRPLPDQILLILPHSVDQLAEMLQSTFDLSNFVAFAAASVDRDEGWESTSPRVYAQDVNLARSLRSFQLETLHHEFVHVAAFPLAGPFVPAWVHEGVADWIANGRGRPTAVAGSDEVLPEDFEFTTGGLDAIVSAYQESTSAMAFLAQAKGQDAPLDLLAEVGEARISPGTMDYHTDAALRSLYGKGLTDFQHDWAGGK